MVLGFQNRNGVSEISAKRKFVEAAWPFLPPKKNSKLFEILTAIDAINISLDSTDLTVEIMVTLNRGVYALANG